MSGADHPVVICRELGSARERLRLGAALARIEERSSVIEAPVLRFAPVLGAEASALEDAARRVAAGDFGAVVFTSARGVEHWPAPAPAPAAGAVIWSVGGRTETAARERFPTARHQAPAGEATGRALSAAMLQGGARGIHVLVVRVDIGSTQLGESLAAAGARVEQVVAYRSLPPGEAELARLRAAIDREPAAVALTSPSAARALAGVLDETRALPSSCIVAAIGPTTARECERLGLGCDVVPDEQDLAILCEEIAARLERP